MLDGGAHGSRRRPPGRLTAAVASRMTTARRTRSQTTRRQTTSTVAAPASHGLLSSPIWPARHGSAAQSWLPPSTWRRAEAGPTRPAQRSLTRARPRAAADPASAAHGYGARRRGCGSRNPCRRRTQLGRAPHGRASRGGWRRTAFPSPRPGTPTASKPESSRPRGALLPQSPATVSSAAPARIEGRPAVAPAVPGPGRRQPGLGLLRRTARHRPSRRLSCGGAWQEKRVALARVPACGAIRGTTPRWREGCRQRAHLRAAQRSAARASWPPTRTRTSYCATASRSNPTAMASAAESMSHPASAANRSRARAAARPGLAATRHGGRTRPNSVISPGAEHAAILAPAGSASSARRASRRAWAARPSAARPRLAAPARPPLPVRPRVGLSRRRGALGALSARDPPVCRCTAASRARDSQSPAGARSIAWTPSLDPVSSIRTGVGFLGPRCRGRGRGGVHQRRVRMAGQMPASPLGPASPQWRGRRPQPQQTQETGPWGTAMRPETGRTARVASRRSKCSRSTESRADGRHHGKPCCDAFVALRRRSASAPIKNQTEAQPHAVMSPTDAPRERRSTIPWRK